MESRTSGVTADGDDADSLELISRIGVIVSVVGLVLTIITLLAFKYDPYCSNVAHINKLDVMQTYLPNHSYACQVAEIMDN